MRAEKVLCSNSSRIYQEDLAGEIYLSALVSLTAIRPKAMILSLLIYCFLLLPLSH